ncbi:phosphodiesterase [Sneathiella sp. P13V-1]|uniref:phosphodiesterase n=1 Tax=Sneathiella sp. P13V-1 TaxID=2697366 RepID=UPI00187B1769|nr:phosphodiesterase [Sneathiella sp. P13V-1]MBE7638341.1 phosphodiesterase [Sneathiella sp. P13V-1]
MSFIQITDTHFVPKGQRLYDMCPAERLSTGIDMINKDYANSDFVIATGDLAHYGEKDAYLALKETLSQCEIPVHLVMGNHDSRKPFLEVFPDTPVIEGGFIQYTLDSSDMRVICLDSLNDVPGDHIGRLCQTRLRWLDNQLAAAPKDKKIVLANHHPAFLLGLPAMDTIPLADREALWEILDHRLPDLMIFGHVHRPISGGCKGVPFHIQRGFNHQVALNFTPANLGFVDECPDIAIIDTVEDSILVYTRSVGGETRSYPAGEENRQTA